MATNNDANAEAEYEEPEEGYKALDIDLADQNRREQTAEVPASARKDVTDALLRDDAMRADSWLQYNKGLEQQGYAPTARITQNSIDDIGISWTIEEDLGNNLEVNPVVVPSNPPVMYFNTPNYTVKAVNARTGEEFWTFQPEVPDKPGGITGWVRGTVVWQDKVYGITPVPEIFALDRYTGELQWRTDIVMEGQDQQGVSITAAPAVYNGKLFIGQAGDSARWTVYQALDAETGDILWQHRTAPKSEWVGDTWQFSSGGAWMTPAIDPETETVVYATGNPDPMLNGVVRPGPNRDTNSMIAVDLNTGDIKWKTQIYAHELWDYDTPFTPYVHDVEVDGEMRRAVSNDSPVGWTYTFDIKNGELLERSRGWTKQGGEGFMSMPAKGKGNGQPAYPGVRGTEFPGDGFSPKTGLRYIGFAEVGAKPWYDPNWKYAQDNYDGRGGGFDKPIEGDENKAGVVAVNPATGEIAWRHYFDDVDPSWHLFNRLSPGGVTPTAGNLVFAGSSGGSLVALDAESGEVLWKDKPGDQIYATPVVWEDPGAGTMNITLVVYEGDAKRSKLVTYSVSG